MKYLLITTVECLGQLLSSRRSLKRNFIKDLSLQKDSTNSPPSLHQSTSDDEIYNHIRTSMNDFEEVLNRYHSLNEEKSIKYFKKDVYPIFNFFLLQKSHGPL